MTTYTHTPSIPEDLELELFNIFEELDTILLETLPDSLVISPAQLIKQVIREKYGINLEIRDIVDCYLRYDALLKQETGEEDFYTLGGRYE